MEHSKRLLNRKDLWEYRDQIAVQGFVICKVKDLNVEVVKHLNRRINGHTKYNKFDILKQEEAWII